MTVPDLSTREGREQMRKIAELATPGPWEVPHSCDPGMDKVTAPARPGLHVPVCEVRSPIQNARFIAAARTAVPALLDIADAAEARAETAEAALQRVRDLCAQARDDAGTLERNLLGGHRLYPKEILRALADDHG